MLVSCGSPMGWRGAPWCDVVRAAPGDDGDGCGYVQQGAPAPPVRAAALQGSDCWSLSLPAAPALSGLQLILGISPTSRVQWQAGAPSTVA